MVLPVAHEKGLQVDAVCRRAPVGPDLDPMGHAAALSVSVVTPIDDRIWSPSVVIPAHIYADDPGQDRRLGHAPGAAI